MNRELKHIIFDELNFFFVNKNNILLVYYVLKNSRRDIYNFYFQYLFL